MADDLELIRSRIDIVDLVSERVALKRAGKNWKGLCPFHDDRNPSFNVSPDLGIYKCWSCGATGDLFTWVMRTENVEFPEALRILAKRAGIELKPGQGPSATQREQWIEAMNVAQAFFRRSLEKSEQAKTYLNNRGISADVVEAWGIGYAPDVGEALIAELKRRQIPLAEAQKLFLVDGDADRGFHDRFRGRITFPIHDERGHLVAFGGRTTGDAIPKYINSSDTPLYSKRRVLYGMQKAKEAMRPAGHGVLVEGYLDVIACHRAGVEGAVASLGTALSEDHCRLLKRWCERVTILYDADEAGQKAADRAQGLLMAAGLKVDLALMADGQDPDTLLRMVGPAGLRQAVDRSLKPTEFKLLQLRKRATPTDDGFWKEAVAIIATESDVNEIARHIDALCADYPYVKDKVRARDLLDRQVKSLRRGNRRSATTGTAKAVVAIAAHKVDAAERTVFAAFCNPDCRAAAWIAIGDLDLFAHAESRAMAEALLKTFSEAPKGEPALWLGVIADEEIRLRLAELAGDPILRVNETVLADAIEQLRRRREERSIAAIREGANDPVLAQIQDKLQALKGDFSTPK